LILRSKKVISSQKYRDLFPDYKADFIIETENGNILKNAGVLKNGDYQRLEIRKGMTTRFKKSE
jgi:hypothetical protein